MTAADPQRIVAGFTNRVRRGRRRIAGRWHREAPLVDWTLGVDGPAWLARVMKGVVAVVDVRRADVVLAGSTSGGARPGQHVVAFGSSAPGAAVRCRAFVDQTSSNPLRRRRIAGLPPTMRHIADAARRPVPPAPRVVGDEALEEWLEVTRRRHIEYRAAHRRTTADVLAEVAQSAGVQPPDQADDSVTVVCVTNRPGHLAHVAANYDRQLHPRRRLVLVLNAEIGADDPAVARHFAARDDVDVVHVEAHRSLGHCLNVGLDRSSSRYVAKFDDDDEYGPNYLGDMLLTHRFARAAVVGKHSYGAHLQRSDETIVRFPGREFRYTSHVAGGTLVIDARRAAGIRFADISLGEDQSFIRACERAGHAVCSSDQFNYVQRRHTTNTWRIDDVAFRRSSVIVGDGCRLDRLFL